MRSANNLAADILRGSPAFWARIKNQDRIGPLLWQLFLFVSVAAAIYGCVMAGWRSPRLALYVAAKLPLLLLGTTTVVMILNWMVASICGSGLSFPQVVAVTWSAMATACVILLSLAPVAFFFTWSSASFQGTPSELRFTHNCLLVTHISLIAMAGVAGNAALRRGLRELIAPGCSLGKLYVFWILGFALVGCQLSWMLRPFVGSPFYPVRFFRPDALDRNFYEFVFGEVIPFLFTGGR